MSELEIVFQDDHLVVVNKPPGVLVHRTALDRGADDFVLQRLRDQIRRKVSPVHRLDRPTSGVLIFALTAEAARAVGDDLARHDVEKGYLAVVRGWAASGCVDRPLKILDEDPNAPRRTQEAVTWMERLATAELPVALDRFPTTRYSLVAARPLHGRRHQIRRHFNHHGHPIIGDVRHGKGVHNRYFRETLGCDRLLLHCAQMLIPHPITRAPLRLQAPLDARFAEAFEALGWSDWLSPASWRWPSLPPAPSAQGPS